MDYRLVVPRRSGLFIVVLAALQVACAPQASSAPSDGGPSANSASPDLIGSAPGSASAEQGWTQLHPSGPAPAAREDHTWTITPDGATAYLFAGHEGGTVYDDLWAFDLTTDSWRQIVDAGEHPAARFGHNAAWAPGVGLVIFAGQGPGAFFNDLWTYDPSSNAWRQLPVTDAIPVPRYGSCAATGPDGRIWISHGFTSEGQRFADTRAFDFATSAWTDETPAGDAPAPRCLHACWWTENGDLILYGGQTTGITALGDLWRLTVGERPGTNAWTQVELPSVLPPERNLYAQARWDAATVVFGGQGFDGGYQADTWLLADDEGGASLTLTGPAPQPRSGAEMIADVANGRLLLFGGRDSELAFGDIWQLVLPAAP